MGSRFFWFAMAVLAPVGALEVTASSTGATLPARTVS